MPRPWPDTRTTCRRLHLGRRTITIQLHIIRIITTHIIITTTTTTFYRLVISKRSLTRIRTLRRISYTRTPIMTRWRASTAPTLPDLALTTSPDSSPHHRTRMRRPSSLIRRRSSVETEGRLI